MKGKDSSDLMIICLYVDDLVITGSNENDIKQFKEKMISEFKMTNLGELAYFLGLEFIKTSKGMMLHQRKYIITDVLKRFKMQNCNTAPTPLEANIKQINDADETSVDITLYRQIVGSSRYICHSRPDISFAAGLASRFMEYPKQSHRVAAKRILSYLKGTSEFGF